MTRHELENLRGLYFEIRTLSMAKPKSTWQVDWYKDYRHNPKGVVKTVEGYDDGAEDYKRIASKLRRLKRKRMKEIERAEEFINSISDPIMRSILRMYYRDGFSQKQIGEELGYTTSAIKKRIDRFWKY